MPNSILQQIQEKQNLRQYCCWMHWTKIKTCKVRNRTRRKALFPDKAVVAQSQDTPLYYTAVAPILQYYSRVHQSTIKTKIAPALRCQSLQSTSKQIIYGVNKYTKSPPALWRHGEKPTHSVDGGQGTKPKPKQIIENPERNKTSGAKPVPWASQSYRTHERTKHKMHKRNNNKTKKGCQSKYLVIPPVESEGDALHLHRSCCTRTSFPNKFLVSTHTWCTHKHTPARDVSLYKSALPAAVPLCCSDGSPEPNSISCYCCSE